MKRFIALLLFDVTCNFQVRILFLLLPLLLTTSFGENPALAQRPDSLRAIKGEGTDGSCASDYRNLKNTWLCEIFFNSEDKVCDSSIEKILRSRNLDYSTCKEIGSNLTATKFGAGVPFDQSAVRSFSLRPPIEERCMLEFAKQNDLRLCETYFNSEEKTCDVVMEGLLRSRKLGYESCKETGAKLIEPIPVSTNSNLSDGFSIRLYSARQKCSDLGLKESTEKFGECVLRLSK